jgi:sulfate adenylyltransferase
MAGPREAVWHAVIRRNYGCSHFIVGRDHAGPSYKKSDGSAFYDPLAAQKLAKTLENQIGITILASEEVVYCEDVDTYMGISQADGHTVKNISGTQFRALLDSGAEIPSWYSYPKVVDSLRAYYNKPRGSCFYFVGLSGSGKSTLADALKGHLEEAFPCKEVTVLDADIIRTHLSKGLGFSREDRSMNVRRIGYVASEIVRHGGIVLVANIAPFEEDRAWNKKMISAYGNYVEFFVDTPVEVCEDRDVKGLYKAARAGTLKNFTGVSDPFEVPVDGVVVTHMSMAESVKFVCDHASKILKV